MSGCSDPVAAIHVAPGVPESAATNRWADRAHRLRGNRGQVGQLRARLQPVDLLQREDVGVQVAHGVGQPVQIDQPVRRWTARAGC